MFTRRARIAASIGVFAMALAGCGGGSTTPPTSGASLSSTGAQATLICQSSSPLFALVAVTPSGSNASTLLTTRDFEHFTNVTPSSSSVPAELGRFLNGSCPTQNDFWVISSSLDGSKGWLLRTTDGGAQWQVSRQLWTGAGGSGSVAFAGVEHGVLTAGSAANNSLTFAQTVDGGEKWSPVSLPSSLLVNFQREAPSLSDATTGFAAVSSLPPEPGSEIQSAVLASSDAGVTWTPASPPVRTAGERLYEQPRMFGARGIVPVVVVHPSLRLGLPSAPRQQGTADAIIEETSNAGRSWKAWPLVSLAAPVQLGNAGSRGLDTLPGVPSVAVGNLSTIWIAYARRDGRVKITTTRDGGRSWSTPPTESLPSVPRTSDLQSGSSQPVTIQAVNGRDALVTLEVNRSGLPVTYLTVDGGNRWTTFPRR